VTDGDTTEEALANVHDALASVLELYNDLGKPLPTGLQQPVDDSPVWLETLVGAP
jgi:antitoxin HicB